MTAGPGSSAASDALAAANQWAANVDPLDTRTYPSLPVNLTCSLRGCRARAAFAIFCGPDRFNPTLRLAACAFDRAEVMEIAGRLFTSVEWHDIDQPAGD